MHVTPPPDAEEAEPEVLDALQAQGFPHDPVKPRAIKHWEGSEDGLLLEDSALG